MNDTTFSGNGKVSFIPVIINTTPQPQTNADRIRAMTDEELAEWLTALEIKAYSRIGYSGDEKRFKAQYIDWLKSPVEVDNA